MLYLSLLHLPRSHARWRHLDPYQAHQLVWLAFPDVPAGERPFLFSLDARGAHHSLLVQSTRPPDWSVLNGDADVQTKSFAPERIPAGTSFRFFLRANPTVDRQGFRDGKTRRVAVGTNPELVFRQMGRPKDAPSSPEAIEAWRRQELNEWLERQGERGGFCIRSCEPGPIISRRVVRIEHGRPRSRPMIFHEVEFTGALIVTDGEDFARARIQGVGRGKAFGYGLMMVRGA